MEYRTSSTPGIWHPKTITIYLSNSLQKQEQEIKEQTPTNKELIAMARTIQPDLSWYPKRI